VLLKNAGKALPIPAGSRIFVAGKNADDLGHQAGGWTITWQGGSGDITTGTTILDGIRKAARSTSSSVTYSKDGSGIKDSFTRAIVVVGEKPYAEGNGDRPNGLDLDDDDLATLAKLKSSGVPTIVVLVSGRPMDIASLLPSWDALLASWLPGTEGDGVADVLFGAYKPTGRLPSTWMRSVDQQPINKGDGKSGLFPFGYGLTYGPRGTTTVLASTD
jgi:beta-glucosidase